MRRLSRPFALAAALAALLTVSCGGTTGLEIRVDLPPSWKAGVDFNQIRVQVDAESNTTEGDTYPITSLTPKPYIVYVFADGKTPHYKVTVRADAWMNNDIKKTTLIPNVVLEQGAIKSLVADLSQ